MNRTFALIGVLVVLGLAGYFISKNSSNTSSALDIADRQFAVENREDISKIFIAQRSGKKLLLEKKGNQWLIDNEYVAHPNVVQNMLDVLTGLEMQFIPPQSAYDIMMKAIGRIGIKVEIYGENDALLKSYQVGGTTSGELGTVFLMDGSQQPYVMELPNFEGSLRGRYLFDHPDQLRDRTVFAFEENNIQEISINYPKDRKSSFKLVRSGDDLEIKPYDENGYKLDGKMRAGAIQQFLRGFKDMDAEAYENTHMLRDSITSLVPIAEIEVKGTEGNSRKIKMFSSLDVFNPEINTRAVNIDKRVERYFIDCSWGDFMLVQHLLFRKILWKYEEFFES